MYHLQQKIVVAAIITVLGITARSAQTPFSKIEGIPLADAQNGISGIQLAQNSKYPNVTYKDAFEQFFFCPVWSDMRFTGYCSYNGNRTMIEIEFAINSNDHTFTYAGFFMDGGRQEIVLLEKLADRAFRTYDPGKLQESGTGSNQMDDHGSGKDKEWRNAYCNFLEPFRGSGDNSVSLIYLDEDDIPELLFVNRERRAQLMTYKDGQVKQITFPNSMNTPYWFNYINKTGKMWVRRPIQGTEDDTILQYQEGEMTIVQNGYTGQVGIDDTETSYVWERKEFRTESEYWNAINEAFDFSQAWQNYDISCEQCINC